MVTVVPLFMVLGFDLERRLYMVLKELFSDDDDDNDNDDDDDDNNDDDDDDDTLKT